MTMERRTALRWLALWPLAATWAPSKRVFASAPVLPWSSRTLRVPVNGPMDQPPVVTAVALPPEGSTLATAGDDHVVYLWEVTEDRLVRTLRGHADWVHAVAFSPAGRFVATAGNDRRVIFWEVATGEQRYVFDDPKHTVTRLAWSRDGNRIAGTGFEDKLRVYDVATRQLAAELSCPCRDMRAVEFAPDDRLIAAGGRDGIMRIWDGHTLAHQLDYRAHRQRIRGIAFSPDGQYLVSAGEDRTVHVHCLRGSEEGFDLPASGAKVLAVTFYGPHHLATGGSDNRIRLWDLRELREVGVLTGHTGSVAALASQGRLLVSGSFDTTVRIWTITEHVADDRNPAVRTSRKTER